MAMEILQVSKPPLTLMHKMYDFDNREEVQKFNLLDFFLVYLHFFNVVLSEHSASKLTLRYLNEIGLN